MIKLKIKREKLIGGLGDYKPDSFFDKEELKKGISDEEEHTSDKDISVEIAKDHLSKNPHYYSDLEKAGVEEKKSTLPNKKKSVKERKNVFNYPKNFTGKKTKKHKKSFAALKNPKGTGILKTIKSKAKQYKKQAGKYAAVIATAGPLQEGKSMSFKRELRRMILEEIGRRQMKEEKLLKENCGSPQSYFGGGSGIPTVKSIGVAQMNPPPANMKQGIEIDPDGYEGRMAKGNLFKMAEYATKLHNMIQDNENLEPWVEEKIAVAASMMDAVAHYMEYEKIRG